MATLDCLKLALRQKVPEDASSKQPLSDIQYSAGFDILTQGSGWSAYQDFIFPQLSQLLTSIGLHAPISVLEVGPGQKSVLGYLPVSLRKQVRKYAAFEPNGLFATKLENWLSFTSKTEPPLPCLESAPDIYRAPFTLESHVKRGTNTSTSDGDDGFNVILFCHSMYGMKPKRKFIEKVLKMLVHQPEVGIAVVFHRAGMLHFDGLVCHQTASFPTSVVRVADDDETLERFASFVAGFTMQDTDVQNEWRKVCRALGRRGEGSHQGHLLFSAPSIMATFTRHSTTLPELEAHVPAVKGNKTVKNREAHLNRPASIVRPTEIRQVQQCVQWALKHRVSLTIVGGGHSGHCLWPNVVSVDMAAFDQIHILKTAEGVRDSSSDYSCLVVAEAGCKTGDIVSKAMEAGVTVPLGARPSVGAGLWLQGGIGHLARRYGLACDAVVGAVIVSVDSGQVLCVGHVPRQHQPAEAVRPDNERDLLWAMKGAGTNFGILISVTFAAYPAPTFLVRDWVIPLSDASDLRLRLGNFDELVASKLPRNCSADAYLYCDAGHLHLGVTLFESFTTEISSAAFLPICTLAATLWGPEADSKLVNSVEMFDAEMYMTGMHGGHGGGKTSAFKRCLFLKGISAETMTDVLLAAIETRPSPLCYLHLLQGGGAVGNVADDATAFGCRDWDFACVITGVWLREQDDTDINRAVVQWVYRVAEVLLPLSTGAYGADLGPDPRDAPLAAKAFGPNRPRLDRLKRISDPRNVLAYACPLPNALMERKLIILVTGDSCSGKDYSADVWASLFIERTNKRLRARVSSISDVIKQEYAAATGADPEETFLNVVYDAVDVDVLLITGMRDKAPIASLLHLVPGSRMLEVQVKATEETRRTRRRCHTEDGNNSDNKDEENNVNEGLELTVLDHRPSFLFKNDMAGDEAAKRFAENCLLPFSHEDLHRLAGMVRTIPDFPRRGIEFRHVLNIAQQPGGLALCASLLQSHFAGDWDKVDAVACCEAGAFVFASALASQVNVPLALVREAGKLPPPIVSVIKTLSHISSSVSNSPGEKRIEMDRDAVPRGGTVVVVDDVLATGKTLCAMLQLLIEAGVDVERVSFIAVAEFPIHCGRALLRQRGFGRVNVQSLLVFDAERVGCSSANETSSLFSCMQNVDSITLQNASDWVSTQSLYGHWEWRPVIDGKLITNIASRSLSPRHESVKGVRLLTSNVADEGPYFTWQNITSQATFVKFLTTYYPKLTTSNVTEILSMYTQKYEDFLVANSKYVNNTDPGFDTDGLNAPFATTISNYAMGWQQVANNFYAEATFVCPSHWLADAYAAKAGARAWRYQFSAAPAYHGFDVGSGSDYDILLAPVNTPNSSVPSSLRRALQTAWGDFIVNGAPTLRDTGPNMIFWPQWKEGGNGVASMLNANVTGGVLIESDSSFDGMVTLQITSHMPGGSGTPPLQAVFEIADGDTWEDGRGKRCAMLAELGPWMNE
ncbi:hypothetical protein LX32DRAFT_724943 [Colletotrichum zoysiae]|uniref:FAD-binding PCMH-type domain-containing protein n=1 Tax=Colletotrichum zoysiae TaxID=1216348 RepID=A0AAD9HT07_9PEZI|nr:hypothetical protein LX32DRAFT_724943 [Colletotrichum zoysiae]